MNHIGLFEGIGGFSFAAQQIGWKTIAWCEINPFGQTILRYYFPNAIGHDDITKTDFTIYRGKCDIITGGFPCQPYSVAGKRLGKEDDRHLWPEMLRAIREINPRWVVGENVRGLVSWNAGLVFEEVQADLEAIGYQVQTFILPAASVGAPHRRDRVWFIAYSESSGRRRRQNKQCADGKWNIFSGEQRRSTIWNQTSRCSGEWVIANSNGNGHKLWRFTKNRRAKKESQKSEKKWEWFWANNRRISKSWIASNSERLQTGRRWSIPREQEFITRSYSEQWQNFPTQSPICGGNDGLPSQLDGITFPKWRNESIKAYGNAIVPQVALQIFKAIQDYENKTKRGPNQHELLSHAGKSRSPHPFNTNR